MIIKDFNVNILSMSDDSKFLIECNLHYELNPEFSKILSVCINNLEGIKLDPLQQDCMNNLELDDSVDYIQFIWKIRKIKKNNSNIIKANINLFSIENENRRLLLEYKIKKEL